MGNFEKLSVLVIGVIIVMILVVALYTWTDDPGADPVEPAATSSAALDRPAPLGGPAAPSDTSGNGGGWVSWTDDLVNPKTPATPVKPTPVVPSTDVPAETPAGPPAETDEPVDEPSTPAQEDRYTLKAGQTLSHVSQDVYGTVRYWRQIAERNGITDPGKVRAGMELIIPVIDQARPPENKPLASDSSSGGGSPKPGREYVVRNGDTIQKIAQRAYGDLERWPDIWFANMERIDNPGEVKVGTKLLIPQ